RPRSARRSIHRRIRGSFRANRLVESGAPRGLFGFPHDQCDAGRQTLPALELAGELLAPGGRQRIEARLAASLGLPGLRLDPTLVLESMERWIERALRDLQRVPAHLLNTLGDRPAMLGFERDRLEDQEVEGSLNEV